jgi:hypothetical protein
MVRIKEVKDINDFKVEVDDDGDIAFYQREPFIWLDGNESFVVRYKEFASRVKCLEPNSCIRYDGLSFHNEAPIIPIVKTICYRCKGSGTHGNPAFNGTTSSDWEEYFGSDYQDELEEYAKGTKYDVECEFGCKSGVGDKIDWNYFIKVNNYLNKIDENVDDDRKSLLSHLNGVIGEVNSYRENCAMEAADIAFGY